MVHNTAYAERVEAHAVKDSFAHSSVEHTSVSHPTCSWEQQLGHRTILNSVFKKLHFTMKARTRTLYSNVLEKLVTMTRTRAHSSVPLNLSVSTGLLQLVALRDQLPTSASLSNAQQQSLPLTSLASGSAVMQMFSIDLILQMGSKPLNQDEMT